MNKIIACIPAKGRSTRLPNKNISELGGKALFRHAIDIASKCELVNQIVIDSDSDIILAKGAQLGAEPLKRPHYLATNEADGNDLAHWEASNYPESSIIVQITPTVPFIKPESIDEMVRILVKSKADSIHGVFQDFFYEWFNDKPGYLINGRIPNSFDKNLFIYEIMGICAVKTSYALIHKKRINPDNCLSYPLSRIESIDINTQADFDFAQIVWNGLHRQE